LFAQPVIQNVCNILVAELYSWHCSLEQVERGAKHFYIKGISLTGVRKLLISPVMESHFNFFFSLLLSLY
jgi:hypothetical protein